MSVFPKAAVFLLAALSFAIPSTASVLASSTFDSDADGWTTGNLDSATPVPGTPGYVSTGGNPGGYLHESDDFPIAAFLAPAEFIAGGSAIYGGSLTFDEYDTVTDGHPLTTPQVMISDGSTFLYSAQVFNDIYQSDHFLSFSVTFLASTGWTTDVEGGPAATEAQMQSVLANLQILAVAGDFHTNGDDTHLDNVALNGGADAPEPASIAMMLGGFGLLTARLRKRA